MTDAERILHVLLHDLRTPLGVAQGYLRLMQDGHLKTTADSERAITKALQALGQTARLCDNAGEFLDAAHGQATRTRVAAETLASQLRTVAQKIPLSVECGRIHAGASLAVSGSVDALCDAIVCVVSTAGGRRTAVHVHTDERELTFIGHTGAEPPVLPESGAEPFDQWWSQGLALAVASRRITRSSGRITAFPKDNTMMVVALPLEGQSA